MRVSVLALMVLLLISGCRTTANIPPAPIIVPMGLTEKDVELAVILAVMDRSVPQELVQEKRAAGDITNAITDQNYQKSRASKWPWSFEGTQKGTVFAGFDYGKFYMRVAVEYDTQYVQLTIVDSRNLSQTETRIHKKAFTWIQGLEKKIRWNLGEYSRLSHGLP